MKLSVFNQKGEEIKKIDLNPSIFEVEYNNQVIYDVVLAQRAAQRQGTHSVKNRTEVRGGGRKPYKQKGTGRARQGSIRAPQWKGGGVVFGPRKERNYEVKVNKKVSRLALRIALSQKALNNKLVVVDNLNIENGKTKDFLNVLSNLKIEGKVVLGTDSFNEMLDRAARNYPYVFLSTVDHLSVLDILDSNVLLLTEEALKHFEEGLINE